MTKGSVEVLLEFPIGTAKHIHNLAQRAPKSPPNLDPSKRGLRASLSSFSALLPTKQLFWRQLSLPKTCLVFHLNELFSPKMLDLDGCLSSEKRYHDQGDSLVWTGPQ